MMSSEVFRSSTRAAGTVVGQAVPDARDRASPAFEVEKMLGFLIGEYRGPG